MDYSYLCSGITVKEYPEAVGTSETSLRFIKFSLRFINSKNWYISKFIRTFASS
jgi:hypothetical protein